MNRYLQRLVTRGVAGLESGGLLPVVRSASPIAREDQRLGMPGFEGVQLGPSASVEAGVENPIAPSVRIAPVPAAPVITVDRSGPGTLRRKIDSGAVGRPAPGVPSANPRVGPRVTVIPPISAETAAAEARSSSDSPGPPAAKPAAPASRTPGIVPPPPQTIEAEPSTPRPRSVPGGIPRLEPSPRAFPPAHDREPVSPGGESPLPREVGPRVVIGRINVEVVPQPESKASAPARPAPLTAASVSVIGPLTRGSRANQRLSLRHR